MHGSKSTIYSNLLLSACGITFLWPLLALGAPHVAVFNFHQKPGSASSKWIEKGVADRLITDLFQSGFLLPVQRDTMQEVAEQMRWTPEMLARDPSRTAQVRESLRMDYTISGVYETDGKQLTITAVVVNCAQQREVARKSVSGRDRNELVGQYLGLIRKYPHARIKKEMGISSVAAGPWLAARAALALRDSGELDRAIKLAAVAADPRLSEYLGQDSRD